MQTHRSVRRRDQEDKKRGDSSQHAEGPWNVHDVVLHYFPRVAATDREVGTAQTVLCVCLVSQTHKGRILPPQATQEPRSPYGRSHLVAIAGEGAAHVFVSAHRPGSR